MRSKWWSEERENRAMERLFTPNNKKDMITRAEEEQPILPDDARKKARKLKKADAKRTLASRKFNKGAHEVQASSDVALLAGALVLPEPYIATLGKSIVLGVTGTTKLIENGRNLIVNRNTCPETVVGFLTALIEILLALAIAAFSISLMLLNDGQSGYAFCHMAWIVVMMLATSGTIGQQVFFFKYKGGTLADTSSSNATTNLAIDVDPEVKRQQAYHYHTQGSRQLNKGTLKAQTAGSLGLSTAGVVTADRYLSTLAEGLVMSSSGATKLVGNGIKFFKHRNCSIETVVGLITALAEFGGGLLMSGTSIALYNLDKDNAAYTPILMIWIVLVMAASLNLLGQKGFYAGYKGQKIPEVSSPGMTA